MLEMDMAMRHYHYGTMSPLHEEFEEKNRWRGNYYPPKPVTPEDDPREKFLLKLDLSAIKDRVVKAGHCSKERIDDLEREYKRWLYLAFKYPTQELVVPPMIDEMWHEHILFTMEYHAMCKVGGFFLHHVPRTSENFVGLTESARSSTEALYQKHYGSKPGDLWATASQCRGESGCVRCEPHK